MLPAGAITGESELRFRAAAHYLLFSSISPYGCSTPSFASRNGTRNRKSGGASTLLLTLLRAVAAGARQRQECAQIVYVGVRFADTEKYLFVDALRA